MSRGCSYNGFWAGEISGGSVQLLLSQCTKYDLKQIAENFYDDVRNQHFKDGVRTTLRARIVVKGVTKREGQAYPPV